MDLRLTLELVGRIVLAGVLGALIGAEREWRAKVAGMRTHILVALGSALMMLVSQHGFGGEGDPGRVAAQIVSGDMDYLFLNLIKCIDDCTLVIGE